MESYRGQVTRIMPLEQGYDITYLTATGLTPGVSSTVHIYTQTIHRTTKFTVVKLGSDKKERIGKYFFVNGTLRL